MKVLVIDVNYKYSSTGVIVYQTKKFLENQNAEVVVCYGRGKKVHEENVFKIGYDLETNFHALLTRITGLTGCFSFFSTLKLIKIIKREKPDLIHIHELHGYFVNINQLLRFLRKKQIPVIWTFHCEFMYTGKCGHALECKKYLTGCGKCPHLKDYPVTYFFDHTSFMLKSKMKHLLRLENLSVTTPSPWSTDRVKGTQLSTFPILTIPNGVDTDIFYYKNNILRKQIFGDFLPLDKKIVLFVAANPMSKNKGGHFLEQIVSKLSDEFVLLVIGVEASAPYLSDGIYFYPKINDKNILSAIFAISFVSILLSERETFGLTIAESLCCGTKVVSFKCGAPETVFLDDDVQFVEYSDVDELTSHIMSLKDYEKTKVSNKAKQKYSSDTMCKLFYELYLNVLKGGKKS